MSKELPRGHTVQDEPGFLLWKFANIWQRKQREALASLDLTHVQLVLLATLASLVHIEKYVTQVDVARKAGTDQMMTSTVIRTLERNSLLRRLKHPDDNRARALVLTDAGNLALNRGLQIMQHVDREFFGPESAAFHKLLQSMGAPRKSTSRTEEMNPKEALYQKLIAHVNRKEWWHVPPRDPVAYAERGKFLASSFKEAEFWGRPLDEPQRVEITRPLVGDEESIERMLFGRRVSHQDIEMDERWALDAKLKAAALAKGYDSIVLMTPKAFSEFSAGIKLPRSMELNILNEGKPLSGRRRLRGSASALSSHL